MRVAGPLVLLCLLSAGAAADEDGDWTHMQSYTSGFGGTFGGDWVWHCKLCDKDYRLPTRHKDQADGWLASHRKGHGLAGGAAGANKSLTDQGLEAITKGIVHKDRDLVALGTLAVAEDIFLKMLFSPSSSGPTPEQAAVQRLRQSERINRIENARADNQFLREQLLGAAERQRRESEQRDAERSERLAGAFDVVPRRSTPFFGSPAGASDEEIAAALAVDPDPLGGLFDGQAGGLSSFESALRDDGVPLDGFPSQVDPNFFEQQRIRAASTAAFHQAHLPPDRLPPLAADGRNAPLLERAGGLVREYAQDKADEFKDMLVGHLTLGPLRDPVKILQNFDKFAGNLTNEVLGPGVVPALRGEPHDRLLSAPERHGTQLLRDTYGNPLGLNSKEYERLAEGKYSREDARATVERKLKDRAADWVEERTHLGPAEQKLLQGASDLIRN